MDAPRRRALTSPRILDIYHRLEAMYGSEPWHWAPEQVRAPVDILAGAVLVQHTTWTNAERALEQLRAAGLLDMRAIASVPNDVLLPLIRVSGTPTIKVRRLHALAQTVEAAGGIDAFLTQPLDVLRPQLLATHGIGPESADAIALYAASNRTFIIDAYTRRLFGRIGLTPTAGDAYEVWRRWFEASLPAADATLFQRYHAYIVLHGKTLCRPKPRCSLCALAPACETGTALPAADA